MTNAKKLLKLLDSTRFDDLGKCLLENAKEEIRQKKYTYGRRDLIVKRVMKRISDEFRQVNHHCVFNEVDYNAFTCGHILLLDKENNYGIKDAHKNIKINLDVSSAIYYNTEKIAIDLKELEIQIKTNKNRASVFYIIKIGEQQFLTFSAAHLKDCIDFTRSNYIYVKPCDKTQYNAPVYSISKDKSRVSFLVPARIKETNLENVKVNQEVQIINEGKNGHD